MTDEEHVGTLVNAVVDNAKRLGLSWTLRPATVSVGTDPNAITGVYDGDDAANLIPFVSLIGECRAGARVMGLIIPPAGNYIIGTLGEAGAGLRGNVIGYAERETTSSGSTGTEIGVLRLSGIPLKADYMYRITSSSLVLDSTVNGDDVAARYRATFNNTDAAVTDTLFGGVLAKTTASAGQAVHTITRYYVPTAAQTLSVLLTVIRAAGTGTCTLTFATGFPIDIVVEELGLTVANTGVSI